MGWAFCPGLIAKTLRSRRPSLIQSQKSCALSLKIHHEATCVRLLYHGNAHIVDVHHRYPTKFNRDVLMARQSLPNFHLPRSRPAIRMSWSAVPADDRKTMELGMSVQRPATASSAGDRETPQYPNETVIKRWRSRAWSNTGAHKHRR